ncbi:lasso peptide biosynthesis B2 protein [Actinomadura sp. LOL_016]|uniref:lasso peptide biosynthesis B2 protein n=1 Tax=unclassified Actinomadura TaxID=2626254 RepID=UPI003A80B828
MDFQGKNVLNSSFITLSPHVAVADLGAAMVLVDYRTGRVETLVGPAARWFADLATTGDARASTALGATAATTLAHQLAEAGLVRPTPAPTPFAPPVAGPAWIPSWGTQEMAAGRIPLPPVPTRTVLGAALALSVVLCLLRAGRTETRMGRLIRLLSWACGHTTRNTSPENARRAVHAVRRAGSLFPSRIACLEESAAATLLLACSGHRVRWCHGVAADPVRLHAWIETCDRQPVAEAPSTLRFAVLLTIPVSDDERETDAPGRRTNHLDFWK